MPPRASGRNRLAVPAIIVLLGIVAIAALNGQPNESDSSSEATAASTNTVTVSSVGQSVAQIETTPAKLEALDNTVIATGLVTYPADGSVKVVPRVTGRIEDVYVSVGDRVAAGQPVAVLDSPDAAAEWSTEAQNAANLRLAQDTLERTQSQFRLGTPEVTAAQATYDQAKANAQFDKEALDKIKEQSSIGGFTEPAIETAKTNVVTDESNLIQSQANLVVAQKAYDRMVKTYALGVNSQSDMEGATAALAVAKASADQNQKVLDLGNEALDREEKAYKSGLYANQALIAAESTYMQAALAADAANRALQIAKAGLMADLQTAQDGYQTAAAAEQGSRNALELIGNPGADGRVIVTSPISGVVVERDANPGQMVDTSTESPWQLMVISNATNVWVNGDVYEKDIAAVHPGEPVSISVDAYPLRKFAGMVTRVSPTVNQTTRAVSVRAAIPNSSGALMDGMFAEMTILAGKSNLHPVISADAVQHGQDTDYVYIKKGDNTYVRRNVQLGEEKNGQYVVTSGLLPGDQVVTQGALLLSGNVESD